MKMNRVQGLQPKILHVALLATQGALGKTLISSSPVNYRAARLD
jgi:hypothetical protein